MLQRTLKNRISCTGIGLHTGVSVSLTLHRNTDQYAQLMEYECSAYAEEDVR